MLTSMSLEFYIEGSHGIRTENLLLCRKAEKERLRPVHAVRDHDLCSH